MSVSQATILADFVRKFGLGIAGTTTANGTTTTLVDASNFSGPVPGGMFTNASPIRVTSGTDVGQNTYKSGAITTSTGTITVSPALTGTPGTSATFVISNVVNHIDRLIEAINNGLTTRITRWQKVPVTDVADGDFMGATVTDHWTGTNATPTYVSLSMNNGIAQRVLNVVTSGANGYAQSDPVGVVAAETRQFMLFMRNAASSVTQVYTAFATIRDLTNGADITPTYLIGAGTTTSHNFIVVKGEYTVPTGCSQIAYRLGGQENPATVQFSHIIDVSKDQRTFFAQPHLLTEDDISTMYLAIVQNNISPSAVADISFQPINDDGYSINDFGWGLQFDFATSYFVPFPLFYDELTFYPKLTSDTDTTDADEEIVLLAAAIELQTMFTFQSNEKLTYYRGRVLPTEAMLKLQNAMELWNSPRIQRLLAPRRVGVRRSYRTAIFA